MMKILRPVLTTPPATRLLTAAEAKAHLRVDADDEDALISNLILTAEAHLDGYAGVLGRALITQTWSESYPYFRYEMPLRVAPVQSITTVQFYDNDEVSQTVDVSTFRLHERAGGAYLQQRDGQSWPSTYTRDDAVTITYVAGYGDDAADVPQAIRQAALLLIGHWYENRQAVTTEPASPMPLAVDALLRPFKRRGANI